jgi:hypothetical protein
MPNRNMQGPRNEGCGTGRKRGRLAERDTKNEYRNHTNHSLREEVDALKARIQVLEKQGQGLREEE